MQGLAGAWEPAAAAAAAHLLRAPLLPAGADAAATSQQAPSAAALLQQRRPVKQHAPPGAYQHPSELMRPGQVRVTMVSSNVLAEPYKGDLPPLPLSSWFTIAGWKERWRRALGGAKSMYTVAKCKKHVPGWSLPSFKEESLRVVAPAVFADMKRQLKQREEGGWARVSWAMTQRPTLKQARRFRARAQVEVVHGRLIALDPKDDSTGFAQLTVKMPSRQRFAAYGRGGRLVAGSEAADVPVVDHWVFEIPLRKQTNNRWRLAGRLSVPAPGGGAGQAAAAARHAAAGQHAAAA
eukprot:scaffold5.g779.t1